MEELNDKELKGIFKLFCDDEPTAFKMIDTSRKYGEVEDFRNTFIIEKSSSGRLVIKLCQNSFTYPDRIRAWQRAAEEYNRLGYYCPRIIADREGNFPYVSYKGRKYAAYAEEYSKYKPLEDRSAEGDENTPEPPEITREKWLMTAKVAREQFDFTSFPSGYSLFEKFCETDKTYEVLEDALEWKSHADRLPQEFKAQTQRIWDSWIKNRDELEKVYPALPTSVFQADLNTSNLLTDDEGNFKGVFDFNLCGRECFLNYLFRENFEDGFEEEIEGIRKVLLTVSEEYTFSAEEKKYALMLYRCLKPLRRAWKMAELQKSGDKEKIKEFLDKTEHYLNTDIDFVTYMNGGKSL